MLNDPGQVDYDLTLLDRNGHRLPVRISSVGVVEAGVTVGVFCVAYPVVAHARANERTRGSNRLAESTPELTARQYETLVLLADGLGTAEIAARLGVADETARNHIRALLRELGAHSRLEALVRAYQLGLL